LKKILVTGGAGFIGFHLGKFLADSGFRVVLLDNFARGVVDHDLNQLLLHPAVELTNASLLKMDELESLDDDFDAIVHLAAIIGVGHVMRRPFEVLKSNYETTINVLSLAGRQKNLERVMFASTSEIYAGTLYFHGMEIPTPEHTPIVASDLSNPRSTYMLSKLYGEALFHNSQLPFTIFRPHNIYGPRMGMSHVIPELSWKIRNCDRNATLEIASGKHTRTFCFVSDAVEEMVLLLGNDSAINETFNLGNQFPEVSIADVAAVIKDVVGRADVVLESVAAADGSPSRRCPDMKKTEAVTGYTPRVDLFDGISRTYEWYDSVFSNGEISAN
jgi:UDP-glucose 4-epimerase